ncbi:MAG: hypothetical protein JRN28_02260 [Nitrososphaerota archaeon]|nr:hypothetical protein [Nitrososphaerota archaeon]
MGWVLRSLAALVGAAALGFGAWPVALLAFACLVLSFRRPGARRPNTHEQGVLPRPGRPWGRYALAGALFLLALAALHAGGTFSPILLSSCSLAVLLWPAATRNGIATGVVPEPESILLRSALFPFRWHALAEVKLESQGQARGVAALDGMLLVFAGKAPSAFQVVSVYALSHNDAEEKVVRALRKESRLLSQRGAHLLPLDSLDASLKLSLALDRLDIGTEDLKAVSGLPFDVFALKVKDGLVVAHRAFRVSGPSGQASVPPPDLAGSRRPLLAEVVEKVGERHGWPMPDEYSSFLASMDASRSEPLVDRFRTKGGDARKLAVEAPGGAEVTLSRAQLRAVARVYC